MHVSVAVNDNHRYAVRGLKSGAHSGSTLAESVIFAHDPSRPAPLQTQLKSGDRIEMGSGDTRAEVEFIMLPKEEQ